MFGKKSPEEIAEREARKRAETERKERERLHEEERRKAVAFAKTPRGRARSAWLQGDNLFEIALQVSEATGSTIDPFLLYKGQAVKITTKTNANVLDAIEAEGWKLEHVGYTYMITKTESTAKAITSGQREAVSGILMGVYIFRRREQVGD